MAVQVIPWQMTDADGNLLSPNTYTNTIYDPDGNNVTGLATEREIGNAYDSSKTYPTYSPYCIHNNKFYKYSGASGTTTTGDWDSTKWTETPIANELSLLNSNLAEMFLVERKVFQIGTTMQQVNIAKAGYTPIGIVGYSLSHTSAYVNYMIINGNEVSLRASNTTNFYGDFLYIKNLA